jgi:hypothetical protein
MHFYSNGIESSMGETWFDEITIFNQEQMYMAAIDGYLTRLKCSSPLHEVQPPTSCSFTESLH